MARKRTMIDWSSNEAIDDKPIHIMLHNYPDPDAISSAMGIAQVLKSHGHNVGNIYYTGEVSHPQNKTMLTLLGANMINFNDEPVSDCNVVVVDTNGLGEGTNQTQIDPKEHKLNIIAVIDHHKGKHPVGAETDVRLVGACASIVWEYLNDVKYDFTSENGIALATALVTGIFTDTQSLQSDNIADLDFRAYQALLQYVDKQKLKSIMNYPLPSYLFELRQKAFMEENQQVTESMIVSGIGIIRGAKRDALPIIADELLRMSGIQTAVVFAIIDENIDISIRSNDITVDVGKFANSVFGTGGGKQGAGRSVIPLGFFQMNGNEELNVRIWDVTKDLIFHKVRANVKGD